MNKSGTPVYGLRFPANPLYFLISISYFLCCGCGEPVHAPPALAAKPEIPTNSPIPANLKTAGYDYYGLDDRTPLPMKETVGDSVLLGAAVTRIVSVDKNKAVFDQSWTGDLVQHADSEVEATPEGVFAISLYNQTLPNPQMNLPADPVTGKAWTYEASVTGPNGEDIKEKGRDVIIGVEKLQLGKKTYDALRIDEAGTSRVNQKEYRDTVKRWLVKGLGTVKLETDSTSGNETQHRVIVADLD